MDRGFNVMVFPEGTRSAEGKLAQFRRGIGLLAKQSGAAGAAGRHSRAGRTEDGTAALVPLRHHRGGGGRAAALSPAETEAAITARLHDEVERLMEGRF